MKQVNVLMEEDLLNHLEKLSKLISLMTNKKISISDVIRKSVINYSKYKKVIIEPDVKNSSLQINIKSLFENDDNDDLIKEIVCENW